MAREIRAPEQVTDEDDRKALLYHAGFIAQVVSEYTPYTKRHALECVMRVVGHLCATGGDAE